jgi:hypothetical protein
MVDASAASVILPFSKTMALLAMTVPLPTWPPKSEWPIFARALARVIGRMRQKRRSKRLQTAETRFSKREKMSQYISYKIF